MLLGFTSVQHAFSEGQVSIGTLSEVERRALALTGSGDFVFDWNIERDRVTVSDELAVRLGERRGALKGAIKRWLDRIHPDDRDRFRTAFDTLVELRRGKVSNDIRLSTHDGNYRTFRMRVKPVLGGDGRRRRAPVLRACGRCDSCRRGSIGGCRWRLCRGAIRRACRTPF